MGLKDGVRAAWDNALSPLFEEFSADVQVQSVDAASTNIDPLYGEPVAEKLFTNPVAVRARIKLEKERLVLPGGEDIEIDGKVTVRSDELEDKGAALEIGSRILFRNERFTVAHVETRGQVGENFLLIRAAVVRETA